MKDQLLKLIEAVQKLCALADEKSDSDNEATAGKYSDVRDYLGEAEDAVQAAIDRLEE